MGLLQAALYKPEQLLSSAQEQAPVLPNISLCKTISIKSTHCERYHKAVNWKLGIASVIHPNYLQVLTLPMQLEMMVTKPFPFKPMGLVHLANEIKVNYLPEQNATLHLKTSFNGISWHRKGWVFGVLSEGFVNGTLAISATSYYLSRQTHSGAFKSEPTDTQNIASAMSSLPALNLCAIEAPYEHTAELSFPLGVGRKYARVSGDYNPIHLSRWTAKIMGFKQAIAHGMYSKAVCLSAVLKRDIEHRKSNLAAASMTFSTQFMQPIYLPARCKLAVQSAGDSIDFSLVSNRRQKSREHLRTSIVIQE